MKIESGYPAAINRPTRLLPECPSEVGSQAAEAIKFFFKVRFGVGAIFFDKTSRLYEQQAGAALVIVEPFYGTDGDMIGACF
jgi:hypothetical protein